MKRREEEEEEKDEKLIEWDRGVEFLENENEVRENVEEEEEKRREEKEEKEEDKEQEWSIIRPRRSRRLQQKKNRN